MSSTDNQSEPKAKQALGADLVVPALAVAFAIYYFSTIWDLVWEAKAAGIIIGSTMIALIALLLLRVAREIHAGRGTLALGGLTAWNDIQRQRLGLVASLVGFILVIPYLGFTLAIFTLMIVQMLILGVRSPQRLLVTAFFVAAGGYLLFVVLSEARLPHGVVERLLAGIF